MQFKIILMTLCVLLLSSCISSNKSKYIRTFDNKIINLDKVKYMQIEEHQFTPVKHGYKLVAYFSNTEKVIITTGNDLIWCIETLNNISKLLKTTNITKGVKGLEDSKIQ